MCVQYVQGYQVDMPIFIDLEDVWDPDDAPADGPTTCP